MAQLALISAKLRINSTSRPRERPKLNYSAVSWPRKWSFYRNQRVAMWPVSEAPGVYNSVGTWSRDDPFLPVLVVRWPENLGSFHLLLNLNWLNMTINVAAIYNYCLIESSRSLSTMTWIQLSIMRNEPEIPIALIQRLCGPWNRGIWLLYVIETTRWAVVVWVSNIPYPILLFIV